MRSTSTSRIRHCATAGSAGLSIAAEGRGAGGTDHAGQMGRVGQMGFTLIELVVGLILTVVLALAVAPLWISLQEGSVEQTDQTVRQLQARVAVGRFERDLRLASAAGCPFALTAPILAASDSQVVLVTKSPSSGAPIVVKWEIVKGSLMRRWGPCPATRAGALAGPAYSDNKTMLEGMEGGSRLTYLRSGVVASTPSTAAELAAIEGVVMDIRAKSEGARSLVRVVSKARVGR